MGPVVATVVHLVRHASHDRLGRVLAGRMPDVRLGEPGRAEAERLAVRFGGDDIAGIYSSPLERARETATPIGRALGLPIAVSEDLTEIDCGEWTGMAFEKLEADPRWHVWNDERAAGEPPGGEPMASVQRRATGEIERLRVTHPGGTVVAVSHADVIKSVVCSVLALSLDSYHALEIAPASVTTVVLWDGGGKLVALNETCRP